MSKAFGRVARREVGSATPYSALHESEQNICDAILHILLGLGLGWISVLALSIEMASLQQTQPEGLALAAIAGTAGTIGNTIIVPLFFFILFDDFSGFSVFSNQPGAVYVGRVLSPSPWSATEVRAGTTGGATWASSSSDCYQYC